MWCGGWSRLRLRVGSDQTEMCMRGRHRNAAVTESTSMWHAAFHYIITVHSGEKNRDHPYLASKDDLGSNEEKR